MILLKVSGLAKSVYYYTLSKTNKDDKNKEIIDKIKEIFINNKERYGYRRITLELRNQGYNVNHKKVYRIMVKLGLKPLKRNKRKYSSYKGTVGKIAENLIERDFNADKPNKKWYTDVTEFNLRGEKCYLSPILDGFNGEVISYNTSKSPNLEQINDMLNKAFDKNNNLDGLIFHSDQGWQYQHQSYQQRLKNNGIKQSMSRKGNSMDNGMMENFFGLLKTEMFYDQEDNYKTFMELNTLMSFVSIVICGSLSFAINPTTLSGKQASNSNIAVLAILAAIVIQRVPLSHILLCFNPSSEYVLL